MLLSMGITTLVLVGTVIILAYRFMIRHFDYWKKRGIPYIQPKPFFGNYYEMATFKKCTALGFQEIYNQINVPVVGLFVFDSPVLMLRCPKLINDVLIRDSAQFIDRSTAVADHNVIMSSMLFFQKGSNWKQCKARVSPIFSPIKIKGMFPILTEICYKLQDQLDKQSKVDLKNAFSRYSTEVVARCLFELTTDAMENENSEFFRVTQGLLAFTLRNAIAHSSYFIKPELVKLFKLDFVDSNSVEYIKNVLAEALSAKERDERRSRDLLGVLKEMESTKQANGQLSDKDAQEILGNAIAFLFTGIDTISCIISLTLYELTVHQDIQDKLRKQILEEFTCQENISFESLNNVKFLDMCLLETMRKYPLISHICRTALSDYTFTGTEIVIEKGTPIYISLYGLHMDEKYFPNPTEFDPYRFESPYNGNGQLYFLPFGGGPRTCIAERFADFVLKTSLMNLILKYKFVKCPTTPEKIEFEIKSFFSRPTTKMEVTIVPF